MAKIKHTVLILPKDMKGADYVDPTDCALTRAMKRHFKTEEVTCNPYTATLFWNKPEVKLFIIEGGFSPEDFNFIKEIKEPYPVVLIEQ